MIVTERSRRTGAAREWVDAEEVGLAPPRGSHEVTGVPKEGLPLPVEAVAAIAARAGLPFDAGRFDYLLKMVPDRAGQTVVAEGTAIELREVEEDMGAYDRLPPPLRRALSGMVNAFDSVAVLKSYRPPLVGVILTTLGEEERKELVAFYRQLGRPYVGTIARPWDRRREASRKAGRRSSKPSPRNRAALAAAEKLAGAEGIE